VPRFYLEGGDFGCWGHICGLKRVYGCKASDGAVGYRDEHGGPGVWWAHYRVFPGTREFFWKDL
jgi:hypothetical protein